MVKVASSFVHSFCHICKKGSDEYTLKKRYYNWVGIAFKYLQEALLDQKRFFYTCQLTRYPNPPQLYSSRPLKTAVDTSPVVSGYLYLLPRDAGDGRRRRDERGEIWQMPERRLNLPSCPTASDNRGSVDEAQVAVVALLDKPRIKQWHLTER